MSSVIGKISLVIDKESIWRSLASSGRLFSWTANPATLRLMGECSWSSVIGHQVQGVSAQGGAGACSGCNAKDEALGSWTSILIKVYYDGNTARSKVQVNSILLDVQ
ncbi:MAG: hypothetical protein V7K38_26750 [Nostoc sp.]|uniref:hypothetical protein n=1 Tax=Nostoc sp. TaxID=1180 RepID=UPI002FF495C2